MKGQEKYFQDNPSPRACKAGVAISFVKNSLRLLRLCLAMTILCLLPLSANAEICKDSNGAPVGGADSLSVSIIYCVKQSFHDATVGKDGNSGYLGAITTFLKPYTYSAMAVALTLFGIKLLTNGVEDPLKEGGMILLKISLILYLIAMASSHYQSCTDAMSELISWVSSGFSTVTRSCVSPALPSDASAKEYLVWQEFDCMFQAIFGLSTDPKFIASSLLVALGAALLSGTLGVAVIMIGICSFVALLLTLARALYLVLLAYFTLAFMFILTPLIVPILIFESKYTTDIFWKWVGLITSTIFQPLFLIAFMSFAVMVEDSFIEGNIADTNGQPLCILSQTTNNETTQDGSGLCSFKQLWLKKVDVSAGKLTDQTIQTKIEIGSTGGQVVSGDPQAKSSNGSSVLGTITNKLKNAWDATGQAIASAAGFVISGYTKIRDGQLSLKQLFVTLLAFTIVSLIMRNLMEVIPHMAQSITVSVGIGLLKQAQVPMEGVIASAVKGLGDSMYANSKYKDKDGKEKTKRGLSGVGGLLSIRSNLGGSAKQVGSYMRKHW